MLRAIELARLGQGAVEPNPMVGCVLVRDGQIIGQGYHRGFGGPHAEIEALASLGCAATQKGQPPTCRWSPVAITARHRPVPKRSSKRSVARVVVAMSDPFPKVAGGGLKQLRDAGIEVTTSVLEREAKALCRPYLKDCTQESPG